MNFKNIQGYEGLYSISDEGKVWSHRSNKFLKETSGDNGYLQVNLYKNKSSKYFRIHKLVASHFLGEIPAGLTVDHIDGNKKNNSVKNLQFLSRGENAKKANIGKKLSNETRERISLKRKGCTSNRKGVILSEQTKQKMRISHKKRFQTN